MNRRTFLKLAGMGSISLAAGCSPPEKHLYTLVHAPDDMVTGKAQWYASTCRECPAGCGILAKNREARVVKIEGNPLHPVNRGKLCMRGQAALQGVYNPDRLKTPLLKENGNWKPVSFSTAVGLVKSKAEEAAAKGAERVGLITEVVGETQLDLMRRSLKNWKSKRLLVFEPYAYETLKAANRSVFGVDGLPSYRMDQAQVLVSFGADFLETWLSPVEYTRKFKAMHAWHNGAKGLFFHISPYESLTCANADYWLACNPGSEAAIALGLIRQALDIGKGKTLPASVRNALLKSTAGYTQERILEVSGIALEPYENMILQIMAAERPLILGMGTMASDHNALQTDLAVNLLNLILDPDRQLFDFGARHRVEMADRRSDVLEFVEALRAEPVDLLLLNHVNPVHALHPATGVREALRHDRVFVVSIASFVDETSQQADLILPVRMPLESWDEFGGKLGLLSTLQPAMGRLTQAPELGDILLITAFGHDRPAETYKQYLIQRLADQHGVGNETQWVQMLQTGGLLDVEPKPASVSKEPDPKAFIDILQVKVEKPSAELTFTAMPSIRFFDGRGANKPWLCEIPDPLTRVAWQSPLVLHPETAAKSGVHQEDIVRVQSEHGSLEAPAYVNEIVTPGAVVMGLGQGHSAYGRYAAERGQNPVLLLPPSADAASGGPAGSISGISLEATGRTHKLARMYGSGTQRGRPFALSVTLEELERGGAHQKDGLTMRDFPLTLPLPEGYDPKRDFYPAHGHDTYRWGMVVDLDRCTGCNACSAACYAENNIGIVGEKRILEGREMTWLGVERYFDDNDPKRITFLPLPCQHCDNAPCESVCPVYAPHHSKEGINNQIYNRCIGTRFCVQNCPYKVRRFNWFSWQWPKPLNLQLNPDVTVRSKGVMEKCSFCIQRIKEARTRARNEKRLIRDGEVTPACVQTCPTDALVFGNLMEQNSRVRRMVDDPRAYQVMGYLNTKPAVIYLKKVIQVL